MGEGPGRVQRHRAVRAFESPGEILPLEREQGLPFADRGRCWGHRRRVRQQPCGLFVMRDVRQEVAKQEHRVPGRRALDGVAVGRDRHRQPGVEESLAVHVVAKAAFERRRIAECLDRGVGGGTPCASCAVNAVSVAACRPPSPSFR